MGAAITERTPSYSVWDFLGGEQMDFCAKQVWEDVRKEQEDIVSCTTDGKERLGPLGTTSRSAASIQIFPVCNFPQKKWQPA